MFSSQPLTSRALELGFNLVGITSALPSPRLEAYQRWIAAGMHGDMAYMARPDRQRRRADLDAILLGARSLIVVGMDYHALNVPAAVLSDPTRGRIAAYAWGRDYHETMTPRLEALADWLRVESQESIATRVYVDTGAILERSHAQQAGLGFIGKNTMLIGARRGSYFFLGELLTDLAFDVYDTPHRETMCGLCQRCQPACPTSAFPAPYTLDSRRCISYLTIEHQGAIPRDLRPLMGNWVYGCDVCQDVCPFNRFALPSPLLEVTRERAAPPLRDLLAMDAADFRDRFAGSPIARLKRDRLVRNACVAAGNSGDRDLVPLLETLLSDPAPLVRSHAAWAIGRLGSHETGTIADLLCHHRTRETDPDVQQEIDLILGEDVC
ncbi:MAG TPA: tRNA epoxyqueuosine(34) reductase QueG [Aggregatilineales bacterium]|nr:tRNA epoxyqueuosine(34) reductase QueG [Aggregatilineales bacterium]